MKNFDAQGHVTGCSVYVDDIPEIRGTLHGVIFDAPVARGVIKSLDTSAAQALPGVVRILSSKDIPGKNQIGGIIPDEPLLADGEVHFIGQPVLLIIAESEQIARDARVLIRIEVDALPAIMDPREAHRKGEIIGTPRTFRLGDTGAEWQRCAHVFEGRADCNGQEHLYIETQGAYAVPMENGHLRIHSSTQGPTAVQRTATRVLSLPMHMIEVDVTRLGGGFGGKEDQATAWGVLAALAAHLLKRPVKIILHRLDDLRMTGKRHPYSADFRIGLSEDLEILAYEATLFQNAGAYADLSPSVLERTLYHCTNSYYVPHVTATACSCRTNLPPNTAFRGFGGPQGMFVIEAAIAHAAHALGVPAHEIQQKNLLAEGDVFPYGQVAEGVEIRRIWQQLDEKFTIRKTEAEIAKFNKTHERLKKGVALMPVCFGISFTKTPMNQGRALVHVYHDGSIGVSTGAVEMGQGVNSKMLQVAAHVFSVKPEQVKIESTNTTRIANTSPSAASATADLNGKALEAACMNVLGRLKVCAAGHLGTSPDEIAIDDERVFVCGKPSDWSWQKLIGTAFLDRVCLSEHAHYATPLIHYDKEKETGHPFAYHAYGLAMLIVTVDCLRGTYRFDAVRMVHDFGKSMNTIVDYGQVEGGLVQGIGWMTMEEVCYTPEGRLASGALSTYKIPDIYAVPEEVTIVPLDTESTGMAIFKSKAVGEPPLMYGIGAYFAIQNAIRAFRPEMPVLCDAPFTPEKVLMALYDAPALQSDLSIMAVGEKA